MTQARLPDTVTPALLLQNPYLFNFSPLKLTRWRKAKANVRRGVANARIACVGDSTTRGQGAGTTTAQGPNAWPVQLSALLTAGGLSSVAHNVLCTGNTTISSFDSRFDNYTSANALGFMTDTKHATAIGYSDVANAVSNFLLAA